MKKQMTAVLALGALLLSGSVLAQAKFTVGVGHMCCDGCKTAAKAALERVASDVAIDGKNVTITLKQGQNIMPALNALRRGSFPASRIDAGSDTVTLSGLHLCCGGCKAALTKSLTDAKVEALDPDSIKIGEDSTLTLKAKAGKSLDLTPILAAMEKGGFSPARITLAKAAAAGEQKSTRAARR